MYQAPISIYDNATQLQWYAIRLSSDALVPRARKIVLVGQQGGRSVHPIERAHLTIQKSCDALNIELIHPMGRAITHPPQDQKED